jgi:hypothetical protein
MSATENHEILRVIHHSGLKCRTPPGNPPVLQKAVHVQVGKHGADHSPYAKGNFQFDRVVTGWRESFTVLDLRLKR